MRELTIFRCGPRVGCGWLGPILRGAAESGGSLLATITQLDGAFGLGDLDAKRDVCAGALAGLLKTAAREWTGVACKAIDLAPSLAESSLGDVWREIMSAGPVEVGLSANGPVTLELKNEPLTGEGPPFGPSDVVLITGGARGVTAAVALAIAEQYQPTLILCGRTAIDQREPDWLRGCETEAAIKQAIASNFQPRPSPKTIEAEYRATVARREAQANIARMKDAGSRVIYRALDVADAGAVAAVLAELRSLAGPITHLIHGAGVLADRRLDDLTDYQFMQVYRTKVVGIETLLAAVQDKPLKSLVFFSSSTGRFGRTGQVAYAAANEALNKMAQRHRRQFPTCKVVAINWGPWDGGMVTPALRKIFASEGVGVDSASSGG